MTNICWVTYPWLADRERIQAFVRTVDILKEGGQDVTVVTMSELTTEAFIDARNITDDLDTMSDLPTEELQTIEREYGVALRRQVYTVLVQEKPQFRFSSQLAPDASRVRRAIDRLGKLIRCFESLFEEKQYDAVFIGVGPSLAFRAAHLTATRFDVPLRMFHPSPFSESRCLLFDHQLARPSDIVGLPTGTVSEDSLNSVETHISDVEGTAPTGKTSSEITLDKVKTYLTRLKSGFKSGVSRRVVLWNTLRRRAVSQYNRFRRFDDFDTEKEFVFLPLHSTPDTQLLLRENHYTYQETLVRTVANNLPTGVELYVKEHPAFAGRYRGEIYRTITAQSNARLLPTRTDPHQILEHANAVATIRSTTGLEALMHNVPVAAFGQPYYGNAPAVVKITDLNNIERTLQTVLTMATDSNANREYLARLYEGQFDTPYWQSDITEDYAERMAEGMIEAASS
jgi:glutathione S-transferase